MMVFANFWPTTVEGWVGLISLIVGLVGAIVALVPTIIKLVKTLKQVIKDKNWAKIMKMALAAMKQAEASHKDGKEKKQIVVEAVKAGCEELGIELDEKLLQDLSDYVDSLIHWHNEMSESEGE